MRLVRPLLLAAACFAVSLSVNGQNEADPVPTPVRKATPPEDLPPERVAPLERNTTTSLRRSLPDPLALRALNPNFDLYPDAALFDNTELLDAPAGKHGFLSTTPDGHFQFEDGTSARFWGVTITQEHIDIPKRRIDEVVDTLARAGCDIVRFHSLDNRAGLAYGFIRRTILDETAADTQHFDAEYQDRLFYWVHKLKERGIYSFIVLRGFRHYTSADGVPNAEKLPRGATPYAFFNPRLIELQVQYANDLLFKAVNPYTGLPLGRDASVALVELFNEDSLFSRPERWQNMIEPYRTEFIGLWNKYLLRTYGSTANLRRAWTNERGEHALQSTESIEASTVALPTMPKSEGFLQADSAPYTDPLRSPARRRDAVRFAIELQRTYFHTMLDELDSMGLKVPVTGVVAGDVVPDMFSAAQEFGFTAENMYREHPTFEPGREWLPPYYYGNHNPMMEDDAGEGIPFVARYRWSGSPLAVREWNACWPNRFRGASMPEMAAYGRFQDWDCLIAFAYFTTGDFTRLSAFGVGNDPTRWGLFAQGARIFLSPNSVRPAERKVTIAYSPEDLAAWGTWTESFHKLAYLYRVENALLTTATAESFTTSTDCTVMAGRSHDTPWTGSHGVVFSNATHTNSSHTTAALPGQTIWAQSGYPVELSPGPSNARYAFDGFAWPRGTIVPIPEASVFVKSTLNKLKLEAFGNTEDGKLAVAAYDAARKNLLLGKFPVQEIPRMVSAAMQIWYDTPSTADLLAKGQYLSDTKELLRDTQRGLQFIDSPTVQAIAGSFTTGTTVATTSGYLKAESQSPIASIVLIALDGKPLEQSRRFSLKMVTVAKNRMELLTPASHPKMEGKQVMQVEGTPPIVTGARPLSDRRTRISCGNRLTVDVAMENGTWELLADLDKGVIYLNCDLPGVEFGIDVRPRAGGKSIRGFKMSTWQHESDVMRSEPVSGRFPYPGWAKVVALQFAP